MALYGFYDAFSETDNWFPKRYLAIDQGPIIVMMENYRTGLLWNLFMSSPEVQQGLKKLGSSKFAFEALIFLVGYDDTNFGKRNFLRLTHQRPSLRGTMQSSLLIEKLKLIIRRLRRLLSGK
ncbi:MAG: glucoamylase family protein [Segetibacter sp.]